MFARIDHMAIFSHDYTLNAKFYEAVFGMKLLPYSRPGSAILLTDGRMGMNQVPLRTGFGSGLNHFGLEVEDVELAISRIRGFGGGMDVQDRPPIRDIIAFSAHDPDGNIFDLAQRDAEHIAFRGEDEHGYQSKRRLSHYAIKSREPERLFDFFHTVCDLEPVNRKPDDGNFYLTDGKVTLVFVPWSIRDYAEQDAVRPGPDHMGLTVESIEDLKKDVEAAVDRNAHLRPWPLDRGKESKARLDLFKRAAPYAGHWMTDIEGVHLAIVEG